MDVTEEATEPKSSPTQFARLEVLDAAKGIAACIIVWHHLCEYSPTSDVADRFAPILMYSIYNYGLFAVYLFLVFGGFSLALSTSKRPISWRNAGTTFISRYLRLFVPYVLMLILLLSCYSFGLACRLEPPLIDSFSWLQFLSHLFFLQDILGFGNFSAGTWYLCIDIQFVAFFLFLQATFNSLAKRLTPMVTTEMWMTAFLFPLGMFSIWYWSRNQSNDTLLCFFLGPMVLGTLMAWGWKKRIPAWISMLYAAGMAASLAVDLRPRVLVALLAAILICVDLRFGKKIRMPQPLLWLGKISYSLFLIHYLVNALVLHGMNTWIGESPARAFASMGLAALVSLCAAVALYYGVEAPCNFYVKSFETSGRKRFMLPFPFVRARTFPSSQPDV